MNAVAVKKMIDRITKDLSGLFDVSASGVLQETSGKMMRDYEKYQQGKAKNWGYKIYPERPLKFKKSERPLQDNYVDIYCDIRWGAENLPVRQDIKVRVWNFHMATAFREEFDSEAIKLALHDTQRDTNKGRVISRFHFDRVNRENSTTVSTEYHPTFHLQVGGKSSKEELCWHPETFDIPRIPHQPMELFLVCQLIAANFFPNQYRTIKERAEWRKQVKTTQIDFLTTYYQNCLQYIKQGESLIDALSD